jgi:hypothetical protein
MARTIGGATGGTCIAGGATDADASKRITPTSAP